MQLQIIDVAIGLVAAFFVLSVIASAIVELGSNLFQKRSKDLEAVINAMLSTGSTGAIDLSDTSVYKVMQVASRTKRGVRKSKDVRKPSYMSARSFADGVVEGLVKLKGAGTTMNQVVAGLPAGPLKSRLNTLIAETDDDLASIKAGLEGWFDDTMDRLQGAYKRWSHWILLAVGVALAAALNVSTVRIIDATWNDATLRTAVADSALQLTENQCPADNANCSPEEKIETAIDSLDGLKLPIGWGPGWHEDTGALWTLLGILPTGFAVTFGAPFWFDLLTRLAGARGSRGVPPKASNDPASSTVQVNVSTLASPAPAAAAGAAAAAAAAAAAPGPAPAPGAAPAPAPGAAPTAAPAAPPGRKTLSGL